MTSSASDSFDDVPELSRLGTCIGLYELVRQHGRGGMGVVYEAIQRNIGKRVAVKFLSARLSRRASARERFLQEARAGAKISHPGLVQIFDHGSLEDGTPYILMEFLDGKSLRAYLSKQPKSLAPLISALGWARQVASALAAAHAGGVVHRDLKPENLMMVADPEAPSGERLKVLDFGIAKFLQLPDPHTRLPYLLGTPVYMSPEQCNGDENLDGRSDVYSLGIVLYEMLCGRPPFQQDSREPARVSYLQVFADPPRPRTIRPEIPSQVQELLLRTLSKAKEKRPTMEELEKSLAALLRSLNDRTGGPRFAFRRWLMPIVLLIVLILAGVYWYRGWNAGMVRIQGTEFQMGSTPEHALSVASWARTDLGCTDCSEELYLRETPKRSVRVETFFIDQHEVTNQEFAEWLLPLRDTTHSTGTTAGNRQRCEANAPGCSESELQEIIEIFVGGVHIADIDLPSDERYHTRGLEWRNNRIRIVPGMARKPVVNVTWDGALYFCSGHGKRLPTEAEWELAARSPSAREFPWGNNKPHCGALTVGWKGTCQIHPLGPDEVGKTELDRTPEGVRDLGGNVAEWVADYFRTQYPVCQGLCTVTTNSQLAEEKDRRVVRGGSWSNEPDASRAAGRSRWLQRGTAGDIGFRCARDESAPRL